eukprot:CAMPEP_0116880348 /NCGR_PEP_ID=MMETSP0463-20121206/12266_1 /TAXON_ID=181622 /ORGANISM="Strombidinopsis sp, Strain SopsisLIS2011" /LENGTH=34 /DNA_ID= /DNA_START= /DNA_END= /DNA_ORIENTATION=
MSVETLKREYEKTGAKGQEVTYDYENTPLTHYYI